MLFTFLLIVQTLIAAAMVAVILMQRSEGGGLGVGGNSSGLMSARGAADFLTRATAVLATLFVVLSIALAGLATVERAPTTIDASLARPAAPPPGTAPQPAPLVPLAGDPLAGAAAAVGTVPPAAVPPTGNLDAPTPPGNRLPTADRNRPTAPVPGGSRQNPQRPAVAPAEVRPPIIDPPRENTNTSVPPAAPNP